MEKKQILTYKNEMRCCIQCDGTGFTPINDKESSKKVQCDLCNGMGYLDGEIEDIEMA